MTKESEIVRALRHTCDGCNPTPCCEFEALGPEAAELIEQLQSEVKRWVDKHNQAALNFQQENAECRRLQEQLADEKDAHESTKLLRDSMYAEKDAQLAASQRRERAAVESWRGFCAKCDWRGRMWLSDGQPDGRCKTCRDNNKCNWQWRGPVAGEGERDERAETML